MRNLTTVIITIASVAVIGFALNAFAHGGMGWGGGWGRGRDRGGGWGRVAGGRRGRHAPWRSDPPPRPAEPAEPQEEKE